ncbi:MAG: nuclear transport factor 2 family protein [Actinomycetota bacterium]
MADDPGAVVLAYLDALNHADVDRACALVGPEFHNEHTSGLASSLRGREAYRERLPGFLADFVGLRYRHEAVIVAGERVAVPYTMSATVTVETGPRDIRLRGCFVFQVVDGLIVHRLDYWDGTEYLRQTEAGNEGET